MASNMVIFALTNDFRIRKQLDNFDSLIWNERYRKLGDFQLRTYAVEETLKELKLGSFVMVNNSEIPMIVTNIHVGTDSQNVSVLTIRGTTLDYIFNYRPAYPYLGSSVYMDAMGPVEFGDKLGDVPGVKPSDVVRNAIHNMNSGYGRLDQMFSKDVYDLGIMMVARGSVTKAENSPEGRLIYYEITKDKTVMDVLQDMSAVNGFNWAFSVDGNNGSADPYLILYQPWLIPKDSVEFNRNYDDYLTENATASFDMPNVNIVSRYDDVITSDSISSLDPTINKAFNFRIKTESINDKEMSVYEWEKAKEEALVSEPVSDFVENNNISLETFGIYPFKDKKFVSIPSDEPNTFSLGDVINVDTIASENLFSLDTRMQVTEFVRAIDSRGYMEYPVFQPFVKLGVDQHNMAETYRNSIKTYDWN